MIIKSATEDVTGRSTTSYTTGVLILINANNLFMWILHNYLIITFNLFNLLWKKIFNNQKTKSLTSELAKRKHKERSLI